MPRHLAIADETTFGTPVTPPTVFLDVRSIGLHPERTFISAPSMIYNGSRYMAPGQYKCIGDIAVNVSSVNVLKLLKHLLGAPVTTTKGTGYQHIYTPSDILKFGTYYKVPDVCGVITSAEQYVSTIGTAVRFEVRTGEPLTATFSMLALKDAKVAATALGTVSTVRPLFCTDGLLYRDLVMSVPIANVDSLSMTYTRKIPDDMYAMTDYLLKCYTPGEATLEGEMDLIFNDWDEHGYFWTGVKTDSAPVQNPASVAFVADFKGDAISGGTLPADFHRVRIEIPKMVLTALDAPIELRNKIMQTTSFKAYTGTVESVEAMLAIMVCNTEAVA